MRSGTYTFFMASVLLLSLASCSINSNIMFKSPKGEHAVSDSIPMHPATEYRISADDKLTFSLSTNEGTKLLEAMSGVDQGGAGQAGGTEYLVRNNGKVELPVLGEVKAEGLTIAEFEDSLEHLYAKEYRDPFVQVRITNQRVIVFPGNGGDAKVIPLTNSNTTLMEAIAMAGGITERGRANSIKLMRRENGVRKIYTVDLSTVEGLKYVDMIVQANDYIYIEPNPELTKGVVKEIAPVLSIITSSIVLITIITNLK